MKKTEDGIYEVTKSYMLPDGRESEIKMYGHPFAFGTSGTKKLFASEAAAKRSLAAFQSIDKNKESMEMFSGVAEKFYELSDIIIHSALSAQRVSRPMNRGIRMDNLSWAVSPNVTIIPGDEYDAVFMDIVVDGHEDTVEVYPWSVTPFIGTNDISGKPIFAGDVIACTLGVYPVLYNTAAASYVAGPFPIAMSAFREAKIVGNIFLPKLKELADGKGRSE